MKREGTSANDSAPQDLVAAQHEVRHEIAMASRVMHRSEREALTLLRRPQSLAPCGVCIVVRGGAGKEQDEERVRYGPRLAHLRGWKRRAVGSKRL